MPAAKKARPECVIYDAPGTQATGSPKGVTESPLWPVNNWRRLDQSQMPLMPNQNTADKPSDSETIGAKNSFVITCEPLAVGTRTLAP